MVRTAFGTIYRPEHRVSSKIVHATGYTIARTYLETLVDLPWNKFAAERPAAAEPASPAGQLPDSDRPDEQAAQQHAQADSLDANSHAADQQPATSSTGV